MSSDTAAGRPGTDPAARRTPRPRSRAESLRLLEHEIGVLLRRIKLVIAERATEVHPELQVGSFHMLVWIADNGPVRATDLVEEFHIDKGAVSRTVQHLGELGLLVREPDPDDGRATLVSVSAEARQRLVAVDAQRREWVDQRLQGWSMAELTDLAERLGRYNQSLT